MNIPYFHVDAFADRPLQGNPAGVCFLTGWLPDRDLQGIARENGHAETAFLVGAGPEGFHLRWFTPALEMDLCGHATLAPAWVLYRRYGWGRPSLVFHTRSGSLTARLERGAVWLDFPARPPTRLDNPGLAAELTAALGRPPIEVWKSSRDLLAVFADPQEVRELRPDFERLARLDVLGTIVTAPGVDSDFVSRFFAPQAGVPEDPVTGSAHCTLAPFWADRLGKTGPLTGHQISARGGFVQCQPAANRVHLSGSCVIYLEGFLQWPQ